MIGDCHFMQPAIPCTPCIGIDLCLSISLMPRIGMNPIRGIRGYIKYQVTMPRIGFIPIRGIAEYIKSQEAMPRIGMNPIRGIVGYIKSQETNAADRVHPYPRHSLSLFYLSTIPIHTLHPISHSHSPLSHSIPFYFPSLSTIYFFFNSIQLPSHRSFFQG